MAKTPAGAWHQCVRASFKAKPGKTVQKQKNNVKPSGKAPLYKRRINRALSQQSKQEWVNMCAVKSIVAYIVGGLAGLGEKLGSLVGLPTCCYFHPSALNL